MMRERGRPSWPAPGAARATCMARARAVPRARWRAAGARVPAASEDQRSVGWGAAASMAPRACCMPAMAAGEGGHDAAAAMLRARRSRCAWLGSEPPAKASATVQVGGTEMSWRTTRLEKDMRTTESAREGTGPTAARTAAVVARAAARSCVASTRKSVSGASGKSALVSGVVGGGCHCSDCSRRRWVESAVDVALSTCRPHLAHPTVGPTATAPPSPPPSSLGPIILLLALTCSTMREQWAHWRSTFFLRGYPCAVGVNKKPKGRGRGTGGRRLDEVRKGWCWGGMRKSELEEEVQDR
mmetsp:Transcript_7630/g.24440  ORF Transcript_7630/g.24440 Transcript_7630/m.24440 type:complete len:299 (+) Transcript_7630:1438-2334(+)